MGLGAAEGVWGGWRPLTAQPWLECSAPGILVSFRLKHSCMLACSGTCGDRPCQLLHFRCSAGNPQCLPVRQRLGAEGAAAACLPTWPARPSPCPPTGTIPPGLALVALTWNEVLLFG